MLDLVVLVGAVLVALVAAFVLQMQLGLSWQLSTVAGLAVFAIAATLHILLQRTEEVSTLNAQIQRLEHELAALRGGQLPSHPYHQPGSMMTPMAAPISSHMPAPSQTPRRRGIELPPRDLDGPMTSTDVAAPGRSGAHAALDEHLGSDMRAHRQMLQGQREIPPDSGWLPPAEMTDGDVAVATAQQAAAPHGALSSMASPRPASHDGQAFASDLLVDAPTTPTVLVQPAAWPVPAAPPIPEPEAASAKSAGLFAGIGSRFARPKTAAEQASPVPAARQRVVRGWQEGGPQSASQAAPRPAAPMASAPAVASPEPAVRSRATGRSMPAALPDNPSATVAAPSPPDTKASMPATSANPVDALIQSIASRLTAERAGIATEELLALPMPDVEIGACDMEAEEGPVSAAAAARAAAVRAAIEAGRVEVHLQPILALDGLATVSYEAFPRLRDGDGALIKPDEYHSFAHRAGLSAGIEKLALLRTIHVLQQLDARGKLSPIFINVSQELLSDGRFFATFVEAMKGTRNLSHNLVLEFAQPIAAAFDDRDLESLDTLARLGFTFALDDVDHVEMDFEPLISRGLAFVKVAGDVLQRGLIAGEAVIPPDEIKVLFEDAGLQIIAHRLTQEADLEAALALSMTFGQGALFAEPKPVKAEVLNEPAGRAA